METEFYFKEEDRVEHVKVPGYPGTIISIDRNIPEPTTCTVVWDEAPEKPETQWTNKLRKI